MINEFMSTARDAILDSMMHTCIVTLDDEPGLRDELNIECEYSIETDALIEYLGTDDEGDNWRVHVRIIPISSANYSN